MLILAAALLVVAYRGKGGGWKSAGILSKREGEPGFNPRHWLLRLGIPIKWASSSIASHGLSALCAALGAYLLLAESNWAVALSPLFFAPAFFFFTKIEPGTGFAAATGVRSIFTADISQKRSSLGKVLYPGDWLARWMLAKGCGVRFAAFAWMTWRMAMIAPFILGLWFLGNGSLWALAGIPILAGMYWLGGVAWRSRQIDPVLFAEIGVGPVIFVMAYTAAIGLVVAG